MSVGAHDKKLRAEIARMLVQCLRDGATAARHLVQRHVDAMPGEVGGNVCAGFVSRVAIIDEWVDHHDVDALRSLKDGQCFTQGAGSLDPSVPGDHDPFRMQSRRNAVWHDQNRASGFEQRTVQAALFKVGMLQKLGPDDRKVGISGVFADDATNLGNLAIFRCDLSGKRRLSV